MTMNPRSKRIAAVSIVLIVVLAAVGALMIFNKSPDLLNSEFRIVVTNSMDGEPQTQYDIHTIPVNSLIAVHKADAEMVSETKVGDVIGFYSDAVHGNVYHRVIEVDADGQFFTTKGDNTHSTEHIAFGQMLGKVVNVSPAAGGAVVFLKSNILFVLAVIIILVITVEAVSYVLKLGKE